MKKELLRKIEAKIIEVGKANVPFMLENMDGKLPIENALNGYKQEHPDLDFDLRPDDPEPLMVCDPNGNWLYYMGMCRKKNGLLDDRG